MLQDRFYSQESLYCIYWNWGVRRRKGVEREREGENWVGMGRWIGIHVGVAFKKVGEGREVWSWHNIRNSQRNNKNKILKILENGHCGTYF